MRIDHLPVQLAHLTLHPDCGTVDLTGSPLHVMAELAEVHADVVAKPVYGLADLPRDEDQEQCKKHLHMPGHAIPDEVRQGEQQLLELLGEILYEHSFDASDRVLFYIEYT